RRPPRAALQHFWSAVRPVARPAAPPGGLINSGWPDPAEVQVHPAICADSPPADPLTCALGTAHAGSPHRVLFAAKPLDPPTTARLPAPSPATTPGPFCDPRHTPVPAVTI